MTLTAFDLKEKSLGGAYHPARVCLKKEEMMAYVQKWPDSLKKPQVILVVDEDF